MNFKENIANLLAENIKDISYEEILLSIEIPPDSSKGDFAFPCFRLSKALKKAPNIIATELSQSMIKPDYIEKIETVAGYLNFFVGRANYVKNILEGNYLDITKTGNKQVILIDYASLNIAKPFHIGHIKNVVVGDSLYRIFKFLGYNCIGINHLGDWGTQFGKLIVAYRKWGNKEEVENKGIVELLRLYIKFHDEAEKDPTLNDQGREWFSKIEKGDKEAIDIWNWFKDISLDYFNMLCDKLDIHMDYFIGESFYMDKLSSLIDTLSSKGILTESEGAQIISLDEYNLPPCLVLKKDGSSLYATRDLAAAIYRKNEFNFDKCIYITASEQKLHFNQVFKSLEKAGYTWANKLIHIAHGLVNLESGKISTRNGNIITLEEWIDEATEKTLKIIEEKNPALSNKLKVAEQVGIGAIIFSNLFYNSGKDVTFSWETALRFDGETGPYVQYTHSRCCSLMRKNEADIDVSHVDFSLLIDDTSFELVKLISSFPDSIISSAEKYEPMYIARHLIEICKAFNKFYNEYAILVDDAKVKNTRLYLVNAVRNVLREGLNLLCIKAPEEM